MLIQTRRLKTARKRVFWAMYFKVTQSTTARKIDSKRLQLPTDDVSSFKHFQSQCSGRALLEVYDEASRNSFVAGRSFWEGHVNVGS